MSYKIYVSEDSSYIIQEISGEITAQNSIDRILEAHQLGKKHGINKYLVDITKAVNTDTTLNNYQFAYNDMRNTPGIDLNAIAAVVVSPDDHSHDFIETLSKNSGLNVRFFRDKDKAIEYLKNSLQTFE